MAVEHRELPVAAVQFHPESLLTLDDDAGLAVVRNVMRGLGSPQHTLDTGAPAT